MICCCHHIVVHYSFFDFSKDKATKTRTINLQHEYTKTRKMEFIKSTTMIDLIEANCFSALYRQNVSLITRCNISGSHNYFRQSFPNSIVSVSFLIFLYTSDLHAYDMA